MQLKDELIFPTGVIFYFFIGIIYNLFNSKLINLERKIQITSTHDLDSNLLALNHVVYGIKDSTIKKIKFHG